MGQGNRRSGVQSSLEAFKKETPSGVLNEAMRQLKEKNLITLVGNSETPGTSGIMLAITKAKNGNIVFFCRMPADKIKDMGKSWREKREFPLY